VTRLPADPKDVLSLGQVVPTLAHNAELRDALCAYLDACVASDNTLDRVDSTCTIEYQRGKVAAFRWLKKRIRELENHREGETDGTLR
jgi:hypothetical protein